MNDKDYAEAARMLSISRNAKSSADEIISRLDADIERESDKMSEEACGKRWLRNMIAASVKDAVKEAEDRLGYISGELQKSNYEAHIKNGGKPDEFSILESE